jgi:para-nitrobenzyl esterase
MWDERQDFQTGTGNVAMSFLEISEGEFAMSASLHLLPIAAAICLTILAGSVSAQIADPVRTESGLLSGVAGSNPSVRVFKGIPFAAPPVGELRWRPPQPVSSWEGVRKADHFGPSAMQANTGPFGPWTKEFIFGNEVSEDCLYLNVWTAAKTATAKQPVLVYIHGGAFTGGSGEVAVYNGEELARKGLVVVTLNYRLGIFGFFVHPELTRESDHNASGNYGLLDQVAALQWVKKNIAAFGGDPDRVTIAGQSAGAMSVHFLTASPLAKGLFQRAIAESGSGVGRGSMRTREAAEQEGLMFAHEKGADSLASLRALSAAELMAPPPSGNPVRLGPVVDGWFLPADVNAIFARGQQNDVPTLTGLNADEGSASPNYGKLKADAFQTQARQRYRRERAEEFLKLYPAASDTEAAASEKASERDQGVISMALWAQNRAKTAHTNAYLYYFARAIPWPQHPEFGAFHTGEVPYVFENLKQLDRPWEPADRKLADVVSSYWVNFASQGDPNGRGLPRWPAFDAKNARFMRLDAPCAPMPLPDKPRQELFTEFLTGVKTQTAAPHGSRRLTSGRRPANGQAPESAERESQAQTGVGMIDFDR